MRKMSAPTAWGRQGGRGIGRATQGPMDGVTGQVSRQDCVDRGGGRGGGGELRNE